MSLLDRLVRAVVSHPRGREIRRLRKKREQTIEMCGGAPVREPQVMQTVVDLGMQEAEHKGIEPDLLLMSSEQYDHLFDVNDVRQPVTCRDDVRGGQQNFVLYDHDNLRVVAYDWIDGLYLVESKDL